MKGQNQKVFNDLSPDVQNNVRYQLLQPTASTLEGGAPIYNPANVVGRYNKLTANEKNTLFTPNQQKYLDGLNQLYNVNKENILTINKPGTGFSKLGEAMKYALAGAGGAAALGHGLPLAGLLATSAGARGLNALVRSPRTINAALSPRKALFQSAPGITQKAILANILNNLPRGNNQ